VVFPVAILAGSFWLPYIRLNDNNQGIWFLSDKGRNAGKFALVSGFIFTIVFIGTSELLPDPETVFKAVPSLITTGLIPFIILVFTIYLFMKYLRKRFLLNKSEYIQSLLIILVISYSFVIDRNII
jgi:hypothetical protein